LVGAEKGLDSPQRHKGTKDFSHCATRVEFDHCAARIEFADARRASNLITHTVHLI
jgi:hypothetical protein